VIGIIAYMEQREDDWAETAYNGWGTGWIGRLGSLTCGVADTGPLGAVWFGDAWGSADEAARVVADTAAAWKALCPEASHLVGTVSADCPTCDGSGTAGHEADCPDPDDGEVSG